MVNRNMIGIALSSKNGLKKIPIVEVEIECYNNHKRTTFVETLIVIECNKCKNITLIQIQTINKIPQKGLIFLFWR